MTANHTDGSVNIHTTQLGLNRVLKHNFLEQSFIPETDKDATLKHLKFKTVLQDDNAMILSRRGVAIDTTKPPFTVADLQPTPETVAIPTYKDEEKNLEGLFGGLFE